MKALRVIETEGGAGGGRGPARRRPQTEGRVQRVVRELRRAGLGAALLASALNAAPPAAAQPPAAGVDPANQASGLPGPLAKVGFDQKLGGTVPLDLVFRDESGARVRLGDYFRAGRPVVLAPVYYECPMLCDLTLSGLAQSLKPLTFSAGDEFEVLSVSFDPGETPETARHAKERYLPRYGREGAAAGWHFLTGDEDQIEPLMDAIGFRYVYDPKTDQYAHAAGIVLLTPDGGIARYFYGTEHAPNDLRLGLVEAADGRIGNPIDDVLLYCFHYDPATGRYSAATWNLVRAGGGVTVLLVGGFVVLMLRRERRAKKGADGAARTA